jgi:hypothetical protein
MKEILDNDNKQIKMQSYEIFEVFACHLSAVTFTNFQGIMPPYVKASTLTRITSCRLCFLSKGVNRCCMPSCAELISQRSTTCSVLESASLYRTSLNRIQVGLLMQQESITFADQFIGDNIIQQRINGTRLSECYFRNCPLLT